MAGAGADVAGADGAQQSLDPIERLVDQAARFAGLKQDLQLQQPLVGGVDAPHSADIRTLEASEFHVADAAALLQDPTALLYVTTVLARRIDAANQGLLQLKILLEAGEPRSLIDKTLDGIEGLLSAIGTGYIRAGAGHSIFPSA